MALSSVISNAISGGRSEAFLSDGLFDVVLDSVISYSESDSSKVSKHTIEEGADIADHVDSDPKVINISAILTDDDYDLLDPTGFFDSTIEDRFIYLEYWKEVKPLMTYFGHETDVEDVVLTNVTRNKSLDTGTGWGIDISLEKVVVATFQVADISLSEATQKGNTSRGTSKKAGNTTSNKSKSILKRLIG
jgi:hypothetical protein